MRNARMMALSLLFSAGLLTGCGTSPEPQVVTRIEVQRQPVPKGLLTCPSAPTPPQTDRQSAVAEYIVDLYESGDACRSKLDAVKDHAIAAATHATNARDDVRDWISEHERVVFAAAGAAVTAALFIIL